MQILIDTIRDEWKVNVHTSEPQPDVRTLEHANRLFQMAASSVVDRFLKPTTPIPRPEDENLTTNDDNTRLT